MKTRVEIVLKSGCIRFMRVGMTRSDAEASRKWSKMVSTSRNRSNGDSSRGRKMHRGWRPMGKEIRGDKALLRVVRPWRTAGVMGFKRNTVGALLSLRDPRFKRDGRWCSLRFAGSSTRLSADLKFGYFGGACRLPIRIRSVAK